MRVLLVNDDGPPAPHSPHILGLYEHLKNQLGWDVTVVLPSSQKSWGSMAFSLHPPCSKWYYYPIKGDHSGEKAKDYHNWSPVQRPLKEDEIAEWILVDGSPTTCANIGLYSLGSGEGSSSSSKFDLVISGPNFGRNTGTAFSLCSGTIGAAQAASLSGIPAVAISYAHFHQPNKMVEEAEAKAKLNTNLQPSKKLGDLPQSAPLEVVERAHEISCQLIEKLYKNWESNVGVYSINVPLTFNLLDKDKQTQVYWTKTWDSKFGQLFQVEEEETSQPAGEDFKPSSAPLPKSSFKFAPNMAAMLQPKRDQQSSETDIWAVLSGHISVARLSPSYTAILPALQSENSSTAPGTHFKL
ncbi:sure-like protein [Meira miltonrushii]|uniref:Sure-like protein n=1 Tax=Meira miltonrushii TaxID=1280837 RepID=A0A316VH13_9BASI|nr:sure-like protein [Meira miltonrushii]PWN36882.1 sure-like protein [Meira miltonrushii]